MATDNHSTDSPFTREDVLSIVEVKVSQVQSRWQQYLAEPTGPLRESQVRVLVETLDAHAEGYLLGVGSRAEIREYDKILRQIGKRLIANARRGALRPLLKEENLDPSHAWFSDLQRHDLECEMALFDAEARFESRYSHWHAEALDKIVRVEPSPSQLPGENSERPTFSGMAGNDIGQRIRKLRERCGWSQDILAEKTGLAKSSISEHENGKKKPNGKALGYYMQTFGKELNIVLQLPGLEEPDRSEQKRTKS